MLGAKCLGILIFACSLSSSLQRDTPPEENDVYVKEAYDDFKQTYSNLPKETSFDDLLDYMSKLDIQDRNGRQSSVGSGALSGNNERKFDFNSPKRVKITYRKRSRKNNNNDPHNSEIGSEKTNINEKKFGKIHLVDTVNSEDANLLPLLLKHVNDLKSKKHNKGKSNPAKSVEIQYLDQDADNGNEDLTISSPSRRAWTELDLDSNKTKENIPDEKQDHGNDFIGMIHFPDTQSSDLKEGGTYSTVTISKKFTRKDHQGKSGSLNELSNDSGQESGKQVTTYQLNPTLLNADSTKGNNVTKTAETKGVDVSQIDFLVNKLCAKSKTNLLEFWQLAANYFGLDDANLTDSQKIELFLTVLKKIKEKKQEGNVENVPFNPNEVYLSSTSTENSNKLYWFGHLPEPETTNQEPKLNKDVLFYDSNQTVVSSLGPKEKTQLNKTKPGEVNDVREPIREVYLNHPEDTSGEFKFSNKEPSLDVTKIKEVYLSHPKDTSGEFNFSNKEPSLDVIKLSQTKTKSLQSPKVVDLEPGLKEETTLYLKRAKVSSGEGSLETNPDISLKANFPQESDSDSNNKSSPEIEDLSRIEVLKETTQKPDLSNVNKKDDHSSNEDKVVLIDMNKDSVEDTDKQTQHRTVYLTPQTEIHEGSKNDIDDEGFDIDSLLAYLNAAVTKSEAKPANDLDITKSSEYVTKESPSPEQKTLNLDETNNDLQVLGKILEQENSVKTSEVPNLHLQNHNSKRLALLLQYLRTLPKDKLAKLLLYLKIKNKSTVPHSIVVQSGHDISRPNVLDYSRVIVKGSDENSAEKLKLQTQHSDDEAKAKLLLDLKSNEKLHPKISLKYNITLKSNKQANVDDDETGTDVDEKSPRPKFHLKWNLRPRNDLSGVLLQIIARFKDYGISDEALQEIILYLNQTLTDNDSVEDCQTKELKKKLIKIKTAFENLSSLKKQAEAK